MDRLPVGGIVHDLIAFAQQKIKAFHEKIANAGREGGQSLRNDGLRMNLSTDWGEVGVIKYILVKWWALTTPVYKLLPNFYTPIGQLDIK